MKKVLILSVYNPYKTFAGGEKYCLKIINSFKDNIDFDLRYILEDNKTSKKYSQKIFVCFKFLFFKFKILFLCWKNKYNQIIVNSNFISIFKTKIPIISVQHNDAKYIYSNSKLKHFIRTITRYRPSFFVADKIVCFDNNSVNFFKEYINSKAKYYTLPLYVDEIKLTNLKQDSYITYIGRLENKQKNIKMLDEISKHLDKKINIVAKYNEDDRILYPNLNFLGYRTQQQIYNEIFPITNLLILTSNNEGLPFACLEALSHGIPIAIRDTYMTAKWLVNNGNNGFLFNKNETPMQIADKLRKYNINQFDRDKIINFVETNFSESNFVKLWSELLGIK